MRQPSFGNLCPGLGMSLTTAVNTAKMSPKKNEIKAKGMVYCIPAFNNSGTDVTIVCNKSENLLKNKEDWFKT